MTMLVLVSGATRTVARLLGEGAQHLGLFATPKTGNSLLAIAGRGLPWAADNAAFSGWNAERFDAFGRRIVLELPVSSWPLWLVVPDVVGDHEATLELFWEYASELGVDRQGLCLPLAFVAQDGAELEASETSTFDAGDYTPGIPWDHIAALFVGGTTAWKLSPAALLVAREAKRRGKWLHVGRVNGRPRMRLAYDMGADSVDGTGVSRFPDRKLPLRLADADWLDRQGSLLPALEAA